MLDSLSQLEDTLPYDVESTLVYIAGFVTREDESNANDELDYVKQFGRFTLGLDRGGLNIPGGSICKWVCFCCIIIYSVVKDVCRNTFGDIFWTLQRDSCLRERKKARQHLMKCIF